MNNIFDNTEIVKKIEQWRLKNNKIVFTNGCFDILHVGHLNTLKEAKAFGDKLIVGLNSDNSVKRLKGEERPINNQENRAALLAALQVVDAVVIFNEDTPLNLIKLVSPDVLVKGGDWKIEQIVGGDFVKNKGGEVKSVPFIEGYSTTKTLEKIQSL